MSDSERTLEDVDAVLARLEARIASEREATDALLARLRGPAKPRPTTWTDVHGVEYPIVTHAISSSVWRELNWGE